jgi:outer membrane protein assembly factor BamE
MRVKNAVLHRGLLPSPARATLLAALLGASLGLSGCAMFGGGDGHAAPKDAVAVSGTGADAANAGATTTKITKLQKFLWIFSPYRPDIQQGNFVSSEMLAQLKEGQSREQVKFILGTPLLADVFHHDRWDYPFYLARGNGELTTAKVTVYFKDDKVVKFDGGNLPTEREYIARIAGPARTEQKGPPPKEDPGSASIQIKK